MKITVDDSCIGFTATLMLEVGGDFAAPRLKIPANTRVIVYRAKFKGKAYKNVNGECQMITPRLFAVKLTNEALKGMVRQDRECAMYYFHELTHVSQMSRGILRYTRRAQKPLWRGVAIPSGTTYDNDPAEIHAFKVGYALADEFLAHWQTAYEGATE